MSSVAADLGSPASAAASGGPTLFGYEIRRENRVVARLRAFSSGSGITVESQVYPLTEPADTVPVTRPFAFSTLEQARRFADEALVAFEYLNCTIS